MSDLLRQFYETRAKRLELDRESARLQVEEDKLKYELIKAHDAGDNLSSRLYLFSYSEKPVPYVEDWAKLTQWIIDNDAPDVLQKRLTESAIMARIREGHVIPGVTVIQKPVVLVEKVGD
jgi:hypothetical protein